MSDAHSVCVRCEGRAPVGKMYCDECLRQMGAGAREKYGGTYEDFAKQNQTPARGVVPAHNRKRHRPK